MEGSGFFKIDPRIESYPQTIRFKKPRVCPKSSLVGVPTLSDHSISGTMLFDHLFQIWKDDP
ncbi:hypothetical protein AYB33_04495 [Leptospira santarosai]|uniref:Uncharacterized protein n=1 Tax=Leptospira santarosai serovar Shermani str. LT 821 TaxID=758847 RepID=A0A097ESA4_9LEPT|nr:hypothetical protein LSS_20855 [Leptospira santarosai serovar Shermani str. LT 821]KXZ27885.1 hypothetical protein AYB33_04495 [Leptospira santarosai]